MLIAKNLKSKRKMCSFLQSSKRLSVSYLLDTYECISKAPKNNPKSMNCAVNKY